LQIIFMKAIKSLFLIFFIVLSVSVNADTTHEIRIDNASHSLIAPEGKQYQWFKNNEPLQGERKQELGITESGMYSVEVIDEVGNVSRQETTVAVTALGAIIKIYTIGDSTVQDYTAGYYPRKGWGQVLPTFFNTANVQVINKAVGGTSSMSFYNDFWPAVKNVLVAGDFVFIQFGINDRNNADPARYSPTGGVFEGYLTKFVNETKAKGAFPVLVTTVRRNAWNADGTVYDAYHDHPVATRNLAKTLGVPLIDLDAKLKVDMEAAGELYCTRFWSNTYLAGEYPNYANGNTDPVHFQEMGAIHNASLVIQGIKELSTDVNVSKLIPFIKPQYQIAVAVNPIGSDNATTLTASYPQGLTITLKTLPKTGKTFQKWNNVSNAQLSTATLTTVVSGTAATSYTAMYVGAVNCNATISASGVTTICQGGSVTLTASSGSSYIWKNGTSQVGTASTYKATTAGSYTVEVTNASNCKATSSATVVTVTSPTLWYADTDGDGKGDPNTSQTACAQPTGFVSDKTDLCPTDVNKIAPGNCGCGKTEESCLDCSGTANGTAILDNCDRCVAGTTGKIACVSVGEAETDACLYDGLLESSNLGFKGTSYINVPNVVGSVIAFNISAANAETAILSFRYANGGANDRPAQINLNNTILPNNLSFPTTGSFSVWKVVDLSLTLLKGLNTIQLISFTTDGLANIDQIGYVSAGLTKGSCLITNLENVENEKEKFKLYPNPFINELYIQKYGDFEYSIYDMTSVLVENGKGQNKIQVGEKISNGIYSIKIKTEEKEEYFKVIKK
jgi:lysophospholipase L1-like esterase